MAGPFVGNSVKKEKKNPQSIESQWIADWSECRDSNSGPLEPHSSAIPNFATPGCLTQDSLSQRLVYISTAQRKMQAFFKIFFDFFRTNNNVEKKDKI